MTALLLLIQAGERDDLESISLYFRSTYFLMQLCYSYVQAQAASPQNDFGFVRAVQKWQG